MPLLLPPSIPGPVEKAVETRAPQIGGDKTLFDYLSLPRSKQISTLASSSTFFALAFSSSYRNWPRDMDSTGRTTAREKERYVSAAGTTPRCRALTGSPIDNYLSGGLINSVPTRSPRDKITAARSAERIEGKEDGYTCG